MKKEKTTLFDWLGFFPQGAAVCLDLIAACVRDDVLPHVVGFIQTYLQSPEWNFRDAAVQVSAKKKTQKNTLGFYALNVQCLGVCGCFGRPIGPASERSCFGCHYPAASVNAGPRASGWWRLFLINTLLIHKPFALQVRDSLAWAVGRICDLIPESIINEAYLSHVVTALLPGLTMEVFYSKSLKECTFSQLTSSQARVADNACWAFNAMAEAAYRMADVHGVKPATYMLSPFFQAIVFKLFEVTDQCVPV
jgi:importin subunit beta-1